MKYCTKCLYPDSKPDLIFNSEGVCSACIAFGARKNIDWKEREHKFKLLAESIRHEVSESQPYHCIVPVSGGKDSHYQVIKVMEYGLNPLAVTAVTDDLSDIGDYNMHNISKLGCDHVLLVTNDRLRPIIARYALETIGDISWCEHVTIFTAPIREALIRNIPLIVYGENPQNEYGGPNEESQTTLRMTPSWLDEFGGLNGLRPQDIVDAGIATKEEMFQYTMPAGKVNCVFLGQFFDWDGYENFMLARQYGFMPLNTGVEASGFNYENLDNYQTGIHDRFKYLKFGFSRATDICNNHIRRGRMTREEAIKHIEQWDGNFPETCLGKSLGDILEPLGLTVSQYKRLEEKFANPNLFEFDGYPIPAPVPLFKVGENA